MYDIHCHVLPQVDDGADSTETALAMLKMAYENGTRNMVLTPHLNHPLKFDPVDHQKVFDEFKAFALEYHPNMKLYLGMENYISRGKIHHMESVPIGNINGSKYILVEFSRGITYHEIESALHELKLLGHVPIVAHVEVYDALLHEYDKIVSLRKEGILFQCNASHLVGSVTSKTTLSLKKLVSADVIDFIASDGHGVDFRPPTMSKAYQWVESTCGKKRAQCIFVENPEIILSDGLIKCPEIKKITKKKKKAIGIKTLVASLVMVLSFMMFVTFAKNDESNDLIIEEFSSIQVEDKTVTKDSDEINFEKNAELLIELHDKNDNIVESNSNQITGVKDELKVIVVPATDASLENKAEEDLIEAEDAKSKEPEPEVGIAKEISHEEELIGYYSDYLRELEGLYMNVVNDYYEKLKTAAKIEDEELRDTSVEAYRSELGTIEINVDNEINKTLYDMQNDLESYGYDVGIVQEIRDGYFEKKASVSAEYSAELEAYYERNKADGDQ